MSLDAFIHTFIPAEHNGDGKKPLLLLPRTGANECDLIPMGRMLSPGAALLAVRGNVLEDGKPRFFRRVGQAQFDVSDLHERTGQLALFLRAARHAYGIQAPIAVGHSNGANIAWSLIFSDPASLSGAVLYRPLMPIDPGRIENLANFPVLVLSGSDDKIAPPSAAAALPIRLRDAGADIEHKIIQAEHDTVPLDFALARKWLERNFAERTQPPAGNAIKQPISPPPASADP